MWWIPFLTALILGVLMVALQALQRRRSLTGAAAYRARYLQLVSQLESTSLTANQLVAYVKDVQDYALVDYFESGLKLLETLLSVVYQLPGFDDNPDQLNSALFLAKDTHERMVRTQEAFRAALKGKKVRLDKLTSPEMKRAEIAVKGCYFCSRPYFVGSFSNVRVKLEGETREVVACNVCKEELAHTRKVKVLYFLKDGKPIHWSDVQDYQPSEDFWNINRRGGIQKVRRLELIHSVPASKLPANTTEEH